jgi:hypothetical protein
MAKSTPSRFVAHPRQAVYRGPQPRLYGERGIRLRYYTIDLLWRSRGTAGALCPGQASNPWALDCDGHESIAQRPGVDRLLRLPFQDRGGFQTGPSYARQLCLPFLDDADGTDLASLGQLAPASQNQTLLPITYAVNSPSTTATSNWVGSLKDCCNTWHCSTMIKSSVTNLE